MIKFFNWIKRVIVGWYNVLFKKQSNEAKRRYDICMQCDDKLQLTKRTYICSNCGCVLSAKCASPEEKCDKNKW